MRKQNQSNALVPRPDGRPNTSVVLRRKHKRPNAQRHGVLPSLSFFPVKICANLKHYIPL